MIDLCEDALEFKHKLSDDYIEQFEELFDKYIIAEKENDLKDLLAGIIKNVI